MPQPHTIWRTDRPAEGFYAAALPADPARTVRTFLPEHYEPRYPYPLLVLFGGATGEPVLRLAPVVSRRNFVAVTVDAAGDPAEAVAQAVDQTRRTVHVHSERVYLVGVGAGAADAYRAAFALGAAVAGVAALGGNLPRPPAGEPLFRLDKVRRQRVLIAHAGPAPDAAVARDQRLLYAAGAHVVVRQYKSPVGLPPELLRDLNRWVMDHVTASPARVPVGR